MTSMLDALRREILLLEAQFKKSRARANWRSQSFPTAVPPWGRAPRPAMSSGLAWKTPCMPLLSFCAMALLAGSTNATTYNERMHYPAGRIYSKLRSSLEPANLEHLTLALFYVCRWVKEQMARGEELLEMDELHEDWAGQGGKTSRKRGGKVGIKVGRMKTGRAKIAAGMV